LPVATKKNVSDFPSILSVPARRGGQAPKNQYKCILLLKGERPIAVRPVGEGRRGFKTKTAPALKPACFDLKVNY